MTNHTIVPRRDVHINAHHEKLTPEQMLRVYSLSKIGYSLYFVREISSDEKLAVVRSGSKIAVVDQHGEVDFNSQIQLRK